MPRAAFPRILIVLASLLGAPAAWAAGGPTPVIVGLDADLSREYARAGDAIRRGMVLAAEEINKAGGVLGRRMLILVRDHAGDHARGAANIKAFAAVENLVAVMGAPHTPGRAPEHAAKNAPKHEPEQKDEDASGIIYLDPWAAGVRHLAEGYDPRFTFQLAPGIAEAGQSLAGAAVDRGFRNPGLLVENSDWGRSSEKAIVAALASRGLKPAAVRRITPRETNMSHAFGALLDAGADVVIMVGHASEGIAMARTMAVLRPEERRPIIAHWGITGSGLYEQARDSLAKIDLTFLQTFSFLDPPSPARADRLAQAYCARFRRCVSTRDIFMPMGTAHAYDLTRMLARAIEKAGSTERPSVLAALEGMRRHRGLVRDYAPPFTAERHNALGAANLRLARYGRDGAIVFEPRGRKRRAGNIAELPNRKGR